MTVQQHPSPERLTCFAQGKLELAEIDAIESHLADCGDCCEALRRIQDDTFMGAVRECVSGAPVASALRAEVELPADLAQHSRYRVLELLGAGGMGAVYKAEHLVMDRIVALKVINRALTERPTVVERFRREVRAAARLAHPHIVHAYDADQAGDTHFLVMEYVAGTTLARLVEQQGPLPVRVACDYVRQAALGLDYASEQGMVHRDIKPHNLMIAQGKQGPVLKILDFGLARFASEVAPATAAETVVDVAGDGVTAAGMVLGTADYIAPEQADRPHDADIRADIYGLGCTLYFLLTGRPPFADEPQAQKLQAHRRRTPPAARLSRPDVPPRLEAILNRMLAKDVAERFQAPAEVAAALSDFLDDRRHSGARRGWLAALAGALVLGAGGLWYVVTDHGRLRLDSAVDGALAVITQDGIERDRVPLRVGTIFRPLRPGRYRIHLHDEPGGVNLDRDSFELARSSEAVVQVTKTSAVARPDDGTPGEILAIATGRGDLSAAVLSTDGTRILSAHGSGLTLWDAHSGRELRRFKGHPVRSLALTRDGAGAVSAGDDGTVRLCNVADAGERRLLSWPGAAICSLALSRDDQHILAGSTGGAIRLWDLDSGDVRWTRDGHAGSVHCVAFAPDGKLALSTDGVSTEQRKAGVVRVWQVDTGKEIRKLEGHTLHVGAAAFSPDGRAILSGSRDGTLRLWDAATAVEQRRITTNVSTESIAFSPDGRRALTGGRDPLVRLWDLASGSVLARLAGHSDAAISVAYDGGGRRGVSASWDGSIRVWRLPEPSPSPQAASDHVLIQGTWHVTAVEVLGKPLPAEIVKTLAPTVTFAADRMMAGPKEALRMGKQMLEAVSAQGLLPPETTALIDNALESVYHLDATKTPRTIDLLTLGPVRKTALGVYALDGDSLQLCLSLDTTRADERPTRFSTQGEGLRVLLTCTRPPP